MKKEQLHNSQVKYNITYLLLCLFQRYYKKEATEREKQIVESWDPENSSGRYRIEPLQLEKGCEQVWQFLSQKYGLESEQVGSMPVGRNQRLFGFRTVVAAAVAFLFFLSGSLYFLSDSQDILGKKAQSNSLVKSSYETAGSVKKITFPDGSVVHINHNTKLSYVPNVYNKEKREVWLEEGEAYFEVAKNPEKPFVVHHGELQTIVRGTSFNIKAYKELKQETISVKTGKVEVLSSGKLLGTLTKDKQITYYDERRDFNIEDVEKNVVAAWVDHRLILYRANSFELKLRLKQFFNKDILFCDNALSDVLFYAQFEKGCSVQNVLTVISELYDVKYEIQEYQIKIYK